MILMRLNHFLTLIALCLLLSIGFSSCKNIKKFKEDRSALLDAKKERKVQRKEDKGAIEEDPIVAIQDTTTVSDLIPKKADGDSLYLSYERTACYGRCPIYKIKVYDSGFATYEGINFVHMMGMYHTSWDQATLIDIEKTLNDIYFFELEDTYDNPSLSDLPSKIIEVNKPYRKKRIKARCDVPAELINLFDKIDGIIDAMEWMPGMVKK